MEKETSSKKSLQWHSAFYAGIQVELEEDAEYLMFENEHQLGTKPMEIDVLIIKKQKDTVIQKNIGRIFRGHNIVEYKSPEDYLSLDDYYKVLGYACFYKADTRNVDLIKAEDITISYVCKRYPRKLLQYLTEKRNLQIKEQEQGVYYVLGEMFPIQIAVTSRLSKTDNFWLRNLTNDLEEKQEVEEILNEYEKCKHSKLHKSVMDMIVRANENKFKEAGAEMCDALYELMEDKLIEMAEERADEAVGKIILKMVEKGKSIEEIADDMDESMEKIELLLKKVEGNIC